MKSMTGFGRGEARNDQEDITFTVEISSVNRKQLEIRPGLPKEIAAYEPLLRSIISEKISRGYLSVSVNLQLNTMAIQKTVRINEPLAAALTAKCRRIQEHLDLPGDLSIRELLAIPGVVENGFPDFNVPSLQKTFVEGLGKALAEMIKMRTEEGNRLKTDLCKRTDLLGELVGKIEKPAAQIPLKQKERLLQRLKESNLPVDPSDERIIREIVIFADKFDVSEELTRLKSHLVQFKDFLESEDKPVGRSLDFVTQEINREITTLGNKAADPEISPFVVLFKTELEKIREQVQNIE